MNYKEALKMFGLSENCSASDIKKTYRSLAKLNHPDQGGSEEKMKKLNEAKEVLDDWVENKSKYASQSTSRPGGNPGGRPGYGYSHTNVNANDPFGRRPKRGWKEDWERYYNASSNYTGNNNSARDTYSGFDNSSTSKTATGQKKSTDGPINYEADNFEREFRRVYYSSLDNSEKENIFNLAKTAIIFLSVLIVVAVILNFVMGVITFGSSAAIYAVVIICGILATVFYANILHEQIKNIGNITTKEQININAIFTYEGLMIHLKNRMCSAPKTIISKLTSDVWNNMIKSWSHLTDSSYVGVIIDQDAKDVTLPNDLLIHTAYYGVNHRGINTPCGSFYIPAVDKKSKDFILILPGLMLCFKKNEAFIIPLNNAELIVRKIHMKKENYDASGKVDTKNLMYEAKFIYNSHKVSVIYSKELFDWKFLTT